MFSTGQFRGAIVTGFLLLCPAIAAAQPAAEPSLYRVFLRDGTNVVSYGEYARVADRVVLSLPIGSALQLLSIPAESVDWERTDAYAESVRATRYAATRGPDELALLSEGVSRALNDINLTADPNRKIAMAVEARQNVTRWAAEHFGYQAPRVAEMATLFDDVIAEAQKQTGARNVELSLVANMAAPPSVALLPPPTLRESVEQALGAALLSPDAAERTSLLKAIQTVLTDAGKGDAADPSSWAMPLRSRVSAALAVEDRATQGYAQLTRTMLTSAQRYANSADVTGVERVIRRTLAEDDRMGQRRPQEMASLLVMLDMKLDAARRLRLARDNWAARAEAVRKFQAAIEEPLQLMRLARPSLDEIRRLAGPTPARLTQTAFRASGAAKLLALVDAPAEASTAFGLLKSAAQFAERAADTRGRAVMSGKMDVAWEAASAASGALMFLDRAVEELGKLAVPPAPETARQP
jgi:hypothetical protein